MYKRQIQVDFNEYVKEQARLLLDDLKSNVSTYRELKRELKKLTVEFNWAGRASNHYHIVSNEAFRQLEEEIGAITFDSAITPKSK